MDKLELFRVSLDGEVDHEVSNTACTGGWCGDFYPVPCACGGLIHADFGDEDHDGYWLYYKCDQCGEDYRHLEDE